MVNVFIIGSKGIPARYGGFETFLENLTANCASKHIQYHVACLGEGEKSYEYNKARCFEVKVCNIGSAKAVLYDVKSLSECVKYIKANRLDNCIIYILACRIGPFLNLYRKKLKKMNIRLYVNPDGHEWKRDKWNWLVKRYWKFSERLMVKNAALLVCDSVGIKEYIEREYNRYVPCTTYISYGADATRSSLTLESKEAADWCKKHGIAANAYYLTVGRFVPENNFEYILKEFMASKSKKKLVLITNVEKNKFYEKLAEKTGFVHDSRIKFVGTLYDQQLLKAVRENAFAYIHGHEVGGTNPSLLEAMALTKINLLLDVVFNREVGLDSALYFTKVEGALKRTIENLEKDYGNIADKLEGKALHQIQERYTWNKIVSEYEALFLS